IGSSLLVANIVDPGVEKHNVYLPTGAEWIDWQTKKRYAGGQHIQMDVTLESIPMFIRSGGIIPVANELMNIQQDKIRKLTFVIEGSENNKFAYYDDDGKSMDYQKGAFSKTSVE